MQKKLTKLKEETLFGSFCWWQIFSSSVSHALFWMDDCICFCECSIEMAVILFLLLVHFPLFIGQLCCLSLAIYFPCPHTTPLHELLGCHGNRIRIRTLSSAGWTVYEHFLFLSRGEAELKSLMSLSFHMNPFIQCWMIIILKSSRLTTQHET